MASRLTILSVVVLLGTVLYQWQLRDIIFVLVGVGRVIQPVSDFPYKCHRITGDKNLEACEDMWLDDKSRTLFIACSDAAGRKEWTPNVSAFNVSGRGLNDHIVAMDIDSPTTEGGFAYRVLKLKGYSGVNGEGRIYPLGMDGRASDDGSEIKLWLINNRPSVDAATGEYLDNYATGANSTIDLFVTEPESDEMTHVRTYMGANISTPNNLVALDNGDFYFTNDHGPHKRGWRNLIAPFTGNGEVAFCTAAGDCRIVAGGINFPNGVNIGNDNLLYVLSATGGGIFVYRREQDGSLTKVHRIDLPIPIDNLSKDANGDLFLASFPAVIPANAHFTDPLNTPNAPSLVWRVRRLNPDQADTFEYQIDKVIEDRDAVILPTTTTAIHDALTDRMFMIGIVSRFITVCDKV